MDVIKKYVDSALTFVNSLVIKFEDEPVYLSNFIQKNYGIVTNSNESNQYYLNLSGQKHVINEPVITYVSDIDDTVEITKDNLENYPSLHTDLKKYSTTFNTLIKKYPKQSLYIRGIINPIDINTAISAKNGTILSYSDDYLEDNEVYIINELELFIQTYLLRYHNKQYMIDEFYLPAMEASLYSILPFYILYLKMRNILTFQVDKFHLEQYFQSYKYMSEISDLLNKETQIWLYGNLRRLKTKIGHSKTLTDIAENILEKNNIGIGKMVLEKTAAKLDTESYNDIYTTYYDIPKQFVSRSINGAFTTSENQEYSLSEILYNEANNDLINVDDLNFLEEKYTDILKRFKLSNSDTKILILYKPNTATMYNDTYFGLIMYNFIYRVFYENIYLNYTFINYTDKKNYRLNAKDTLYLIFKLIGLLSKIDDLVLDTITYDYILRTNYTENELVAGTIFKEKLLPYVRDILSDGDLTKPLNISEDIYNYVTALKRALSKMWTYISNCNDAVLAADLKVVFSRLFITNNITITNDQSVNDYLASRGINIQVTAGSEYETLQYLFLSAFGIYIREVDTLGELFKKYINFTKKFTSYTLQLLTDSELFETITTKHTSILTANQYQSISTIYDGNYTHYEELEVTLSNKTTGFTDKQLNADNLENYITVVASQKALKVKAISENITVHDGMIGSISFKERIIDIFNPELLTTTFNPGDVRSIKTDEYVAATAIAPRLADSGTITETTLIDVPIEMSITVKED